MKCTGLKMPGSPHLASLGDQAACPILEVFWKKSAPTPRSTLTGCDRFIFPSTNILKARNARHFPDWSRIWRLPVNGWAATNRVLICLLSCRWSKQQITRSEPTRQCCCWHNPCSTPRLKSWSLTPSGKKNRRSLIWQGCWRYTTTKQYSKKYQRSSE